MISQKSFSTSLGAFKAVKNIAIGLAVVGAMVITLVSVSQRNTGFVLGKWDHWEPASAPGASGIDVEDKAQKIESLLSDSDDLSGLGFRSEATTSDGQATGSDHDATSFRRASGYIGGAKKAPFTARGQERKPGDGGSASLTPTEPSPTPTEPAPTPTEPAPTPTEPAPTPTEPSPTSDPVEDAQAELKEAVEEVTPDETPTPPNPGPLPITPPSGGDVESLISTISKALDELVLQPMGDLIELLTAQISGLIPGDDQIQYAKESVDSLMGDVSETHEETSGLVTETAGEALADSQSEIEPYKTQAEAEIAKIKGELDKPLPIAPPAQGDVEVLIEETVDALLSQLQKLVLDPITALLGQLGGLIPDQWINDQVPTEDEIEDARGSVESDALEALGTGTQTAGEAASTVTGTASGVPGLANETISEAQSQAAPYKSQAEAEAAKAQDEVIKQTSNPEVVTVVALNSASAEGLAIPVFYNHTYSFKISGTYLWNFGPNGISPDLSADAECSTGVGDPNWVDQRFEEAGSGLGPDGLDVYFAPARVDGSVVPEAIKWTPVEGSGTCSPSHTYTMTWTNDARDGVILFKVNDATENNVGALSIEIRDKSKLVQTAGIGGGWGIGILLILSLIAMAGEKVTDLRKKEIV